jgi:glucosamine-6-phosphate deaminase
MHLLRFDAEAAWLAAVASLWRDRLRTMPALTMCLPSGATPARVYAEMVRSHRAGLVSFAGARVFVLDEFGALAADDPGGTRNTLQRQLLDGVDLPAAAFHALDPDHPDVARHCADYETAFGGGIDLMVLGIGLNGHLGMNEPGSAADSATRRVELHPGTIQSSARYFTHGNLPHWGLTVGLRAILAAKEVWVLANGAGKAPIVERTVRGPIAADNPASLLRRHPNCALFVDADAAAMIDRPST